MTIGIDIRILGNQHGGIGRYTLELVQEILRQDPDQKYLLFYNSNNASEADIRQLAEFRNAELIPTPYRHYSFGEQTAFLRLLNAYRPDLMHFTNFNVPVLYRRPFVVTIHDTVHHKIGGAKKSHFIHFYAYKKVIEAAARHARRIITVSEYSKKDIQKYFQLPAEKITVTFLGPSLLTTVPPARVAQVKKSFVINKPYFLFVGVLERKKNVVNLTRGFDQFIKKYNLDIDLVIAGKRDSHYPQEKHRALDIKNRERLIFTDYVSDQDLAALYKGAYAYVSASLHEGFGLPGVDAMQFGLPMAVSNIEVFNEVYENAAVYFNPLDPEDIAEKLYLLARDQEFHRQMQEKSFARGQYFSWQKTAEKTILVYKEIVLNRGSIGPMGLIGAL